jgi:hypothetical protein
MINFSNTRGFTNGILKELFRCSFLEKIICNNNNYDSVDFNGLGTKMSTNLREIHMDNTLFYCGPYQTIYKFAHLNNHQEVFLFHGRSKSLESVLICNMKSPHSTFIDDHRTQIFKQDALIKFVGDVPSLRWFQSDLSRENVDMLQEERSQSGKLEIELLSNPI